MKSTCRRRHESLVRSCFYWSLWPATILAPIWAMFGRLWLGGCFGWEIINALLIGAPVLLGFHALLILVVWEEDFMTPLMMGLLSLYYFLLFMEQFFFVDGGDMPCGHDNRSTAAALYLSNSIDDFAADSIFTWLVGAMVVDMVTLIGVAAWQRFWPCQSSSLAVTQGETDELLNSMHPDYETAGKAAALQVRE